MTIEVVNWQKFNPRGNEKKTMHCHWYRVEDTLYDNPDFADFTAEDFAAFHYILSVTCQKQGAPWKCNLSFCAQRSRVKIHQFEATLRKLSELLVVRLTEAGRTNTPPVVVHTGQDRTGRTGQDEQDRTGSTEVEIATPVAPPSHWLVDLWNEKCGKLPKVQYPLSPKRLKKITQRTKDFPNKKDWVDGISRLAESHFCNGRNDRAWVATFDFLIQPETLEKAREGKYDNRGGMSDANKKSLHNKDQWERIKRGEL